MAQPIIRGIQAVGAVDITYRYNGNGGKLKLPANVMMLGDTVPKEGQTIDTSAGVSVAGFRLDGEFLRAMQQIASSVQVPILGGGAVALTNNNRSGTLAINCTKVSTPAAEATEGDNGQALGEMLKNNGLGPIGQDKAYDLVFLAQAQQAQVGGDSSGATILVKFAFCGLNTIIGFEGCTIASVDPVGLAGNDAPNYNVAINYLNWTIQYSTTQTTSALTSAATV